MHDETAGNSPVEKHLQAVARLSGDFDRISGFKAALGPEELWQAFGWILLNSLAEKKS